MIRKAARAKYPGWLHIINGSPPPYSRLRETVTPDLQRMLPSASSAFCRRLQTYHLRQRRRFVASNWVELSDTYSDTVYFYNQITGRVCETEPTLPTVETSTTRDNDGMAWIINEVRH